MRKFVSTISMILTFIVLFSISSSALSAPSVSAKSAILIEAESGKVLFGKSSEIQLPMASTTKIMTAIVAIEACDDLNMTVKIDKRALGVEGSSIYLYEGEELTMESLLYALLLSSANDAAVAIAYAIDGDIEKFAERMNSKASELGLTNTHFVNPNGLHDENHYTTAHDLAKITAYALKNKTFKTIVSTKKKTIPMKDAEGVRLLINHNKMLSIYEGAIGVKTGFTKKAGRCLVSAAEREGLTLVAVTLNAPNDWNDHSSLLDFGFDAYERIDLDDICYELPVISGERSSVTVKNSEPMSAFLSKERGEITVSIELPRFVYAGLCEGEVLGKVEYVCGGAVIASSPLVAQSSVDQDQYKKNLFEWIASLFGY